MSTIMTIVLACLPLILAAAVTVISWSTLSRPFLFFVAAVLSLGGVQALVAPVAYPILLSAAGSTYEAAGNEALVRTNIVAAVAQLTLGLAFLWWLYRGLRKQLK
ncbi:hypothetical protein BCF11_4288 [Collimonas sp. PA-H2]|uniref:hypothetical protein n=1 Tax=Collimonas sp. PA-H2 TaxID=1881062 RepID=UPI000C008DF2|nr:hypothetical protein [Collimonas sp. PA-H2]PFH11823.1 hypothetical protein BCF11_4288 [Collimonas sp. PA-H2]